ncbi:trans-2,3-dihydro-3-hydroxyanthranilate isomerase [Cohaesibacter sp. ES.047]|uniref:PhzF family phenazine biosynthesis protein n=1 Tax=Cohaesibacter sp. ES.047 TaxID=1798205 RepID=UPI000BB7C32B|nr:PhzF family phenazine biosynthesis protein [Cohaesibacter sp. ES.047]SNY94324.1 trans-2,3-dihydro-3-hydroxyanthranilate isomerase [Cohaesibacter sp. ES.047]
MSRTDRRYFILDVFADKIFTGNPLAVVLDSEGLSDEDMQRIAREFNLSETVFVMPPENKAFNAALRIFTPAIELPFAGHPTVGTAVLLGLQRFPDLDASMDSVMMLEEKVGSIQARLKLKPGNVGDAVFDVPKNAEMVETQLGSKDEIAAALGLHIQDIGFENHVPCAYSAGVPFAMIPIRNLDAMRRARPVMPSWNTAFGGHMHNDAYLYTRETVRHGSSFHTRMFAPGMGLIEDPATGSAAAAFAGVICQFDKPGQGSHKYVIEQGFEIERPSIIELEMDIVDGRLKEERIGGSALVVASGTLMT